MASVRSKRWWYHLSSDRLIVGLLAVQMLLFLSQQFQWFSFNEKKGWTVLIAVAVLGLVLAVMLAWSVASLLFRWRFQFSLRSFLLMVVAIAVPAAWFDSTTNLLWESPSTSRFSRNWSACGVCACLIHKSRTWTWKMSRN